MLNQVIIIAELRKHLPKLKEQYPIEQIGLFGSYSRNEQTADSDIDFVVQFAQPIGMELIDLAFDLEDIFGKKVDLVSRNAIKAAYWAMIEKEVYYA